MTFKSICRVCGNRTAYGMHVVPVDAQGPTGTQSNRAYFEECSPSDNLEYLEWCLEKKSEVNK